MLPYSRNATHDGSSPLMPSTVDDIQDSIIIAASPLQIPGCACVNGSATVSFPSGPSDGTVLVTSSGYVFYPISWRANSLVRSLEITLSGDGAVDVTINVVREMTGSSTVVGSLVVSNAAAKTTHTIPLTEMSPTSAGYYFVSIFCSATGAKIFYLSVS
jgi:hypothetical protein